MTITVYFETPNHSSAFQVAEYVDEELYEQVEPFLSALASAEGYVITESVQ